MSEQQQAAAKMTVEPTRVETVVVGLKMPNGLILQLSVLEESAEAAPGGFRTIKQARRLPETYVLRGTAIDVARLTSGSYETPLIVGGYALTPGIPKDFWERWLEANRDSELVRNRLIFAMKDEASARSVAREGEGQRSGLEPVDPSNPAAFAPDIRRITAGTREAA